MLSQNILWCTASYFKKIIINSLFVFHISYNIFSWKRHNEIRFHKPEFNFRSFFQLSSVKFSTSKSIKIRFFFLELNFLIHQISYLSWHYLFLFFSYFSHNNTKILNSTIFLVEKKSFKNSIKDVFFKKAKFKIFISEYLFSKITDYKFIYYSRLNI